MKKEELQQNMKDRMQQFEDGGLRLLKKGQKGIVHAIFSRFGLVLLLMLLQAGVLWSVFRWFGGLLPHYFGGSVAMSAFMVVYILNSEMDNSAKITWMVTIAILPVVGVPLFFYVKSNIGHNALKKRVTHLTEEARDLQPQPLAAAQELAEADPGAASLARYLHGKGGGFSVYRNTEVTYFPGGEAKFEELLRQLEKAEKYIFLEYFIIDEGLMWGKILEVLARKAAEGVDVRVMYDGTCEFTTLPRDYPSRLEKLGIQCRVFAPVQPFVSTHYNYRDHRKILVIDGKVGFTGGVNLADEYANLVSVYGVWKDTAVRLEGEAVRSLTLMFLQMWGMDEREPDTDSYGCYLNVPLRPLPGAGGYVLPYADSPLDDERVGECVYLDILNHAERYVRIFTPYLILDETMVMALTFAAKRGVDVELILPHVPDKKFAFALAKGHYRELLDAGVKIYEYTPGFVHAKVFVSDDRKAVVGTINLDYRSLYLHFEDAVYLYDCPCIKDIVADFDATRAQSQIVTHGDLARIPLHTRIAAALLKLVAPLM